MVVAGEREEAVVASKRSNMKPSLMQKCKDDGFFAFLFAQNCQKHPFAGGRNRQIAKIVHFLLPNGPE